MNTDEFQRLILQKGEELYRDMPWRDDTRPYYVLVSELMLQQTQVARVIPKFAAFIAAFPDTTALAGAPLADVLTLWSGLGYNRRAKFLHEAAKMIEREYGGIFPSDLAALMSLPGVGTNTAGALRAYAFDAHSVFIETNVRTVYFHHFFAGSDSVSDSELRHMLEQTLPDAGYRQFYWALMDYGSWLKAQGQGAIDKSRHYKKQAPLKGSVREIRGEIVRNLTLKSVSLEVLQTLVPYDHRFQPALAGLIRDGLVVQAGELLRLAR